MIFGKNTMLTAKIGKVGKILICGMKGVGKTALVEQLIYGNVNTETVSIKLLYLPILTSLLISVIGVFAFYQWQDLHPTIEDIYVASVDTGRGVRETIRLYDSAGLQGKSILPRHYLFFPDGYVLVYDPNNPQSLEMLTDIKSDIDRNKDKKEVPIIVLANMHSKKPDLAQEAVEEEELDELASYQLRMQKQQQQQQSDLMEAILNHANSWCTRERIKHYTVNAMERPSLYEPFITLCARLHPPATKSTFPQLRQVMQKTPKSDV